MKGQIQRKVERTASKCTKESKDKNKRQKGSILMKVFIKRKDIKKEYLVKYRQKVRRERKNTSKEWI